MSSMKEAGNPFLGKFSWFAPFLGGWRVPVVRISRIKWTKFPGTWDCKPESTATWWDHTSSSKPPSGEAPSWLPFSRRQFSSMYKNLPAGAGRLSALEAHFSHSKTATLERRVAGADPLHPGEAHPPLWTGASTPFLWCLPPRCSKHSTNDFLNPPRVG